MLGSRSGHAALVVSILVGSGCPAEVSRAPVDMDDAEDEVGGATLATTPGCSSFIEAGEPLLLPGATGNAQMATTDGASVGVYYRVPSGSGSTVVLGQPFESWPPASTREPTACS